jgi:hypothetical protein
MRDIRRDLKERLSSLEERRAQLQATLKVIEDESAVLMRLLDYEDHRFPSEQTNIEQSDRPVLGEFITQHLHSRPMTKPEIRALTERAGYLAKSESPGRTIHLTMVNMERFGRVRKRHDGRYEIREPETSKTETPNSGELFGVPKGNGSSPLNP